MKKYFYILIVLFLISAGGIVFLSFRINDDKDLVVYSEETLEGDISELEDLVILHKTAHTPSNNMWENTIYPGKDMKAEIKHRYDNDPEILSVPEKETLYFQSDICNNALQYRQYPIQPDQLEPAYFREMVKEVAEEVADGQRVEKYVQASDFFEYHPMNMYLELNDRTYNTSYIYDIREENRTQGDRNAIEFFEKFSQQFKIPVEDNLIMKVTLGKNTNGQLEQLEITGASWGKEIIAYSIFSKEYCYCVIEDGLYRFRLDAYRVPVFETMEKIYQCDSKQEKITGLNISQDQENILCTTFQNENFCVEIVEDGTGKVVDSLPLFQGAEENFLEVQTGNTFLFMNQKKEFVVLSKDENGKYKQWTKNKIGHIPEELNDWQTYIFFNGNELVFIYQTGCDMHLAVFDENNLLYQGNIRSSQTGRCELADEIYVTGPLIDVQWE